MDFTQAKWLNPPAESDITPTAVRITTEPGTDFWQRSYYGFRNDNAPALLLSSAENFTFTCKAAFNYQRQFDQCGVIVYLNEENWFKASIEYETATFSRLGSVVTNHGYSDWATTDIALPQHIWYRLNRRGPDFMIESSTDGETFKQMRIFHLHQLGDTTEQMGKADPPLAAAQAVQFGLYACSPNPSSFDAVFSDMHMQPCLWKSHIPA